MTTDPQTDPRVKNLRDAQRRLRSALIANADRLDKPFTDDPDKNPWDTFVRPAMRELKAAVDAIAAMPAAPVAAPPTGQAGLVLTESERTMLAYALDQAQEKIWSEGGFTDEDQAAVTSLRRLAAETPGPETQGARCGCPDEDALEHQFGIDGCTCIPFTRQGGTPRYCGPADTVDMISGWERGGDCPHHAPAVVAEPGKEA